MVEVEKLIGEIEDLIKELAEVTPVHGGFYQLSAKYYKVQLLCQVVSCLLQRNTSLN